MASVGLSQEWGNLAEQNHQCLSIIDVDLRKSTVNDTTAIRTNCFHDLQILRYEEKRDDRNPGVSCSCHLVVKDEIVNGDCKAAFDSFASDYTEWFI